MNPKGEFIGGDRWYGCPMKYEELKDVDILIEKLMWNYRGAMLTRNRGK